MSNRFTEVHKKILDKNQELKEKFQSLPESGITSEIVEEFSAQLEALQNACEELQIQNDELSISNELVLDQESTYQKIFELTPVAFITTCLSSKIQSVNNAASTLLGLNSVFLLNKPLSIYIHLQYRPQFYKILDQLKAGTIEKWQLESKITSRNQEITSVILSVFRTHDEDILHWSVYDINHRVAKEKQDRLKQTEDFLATLLHDLKVPLVGAGLILNNLTSDDLLKNQSQVLELMTSLKTSNEMSIKKVDELLYAYKLTASNDNQDVISERERFELNKLIKDCKKTLGPHAYNRQIIVDVNIEGSISLVADKNKFEKMLVCLLDNAVKYSFESGTVLIKVFVESGELVLIFEDSGPGIAAQDIDKLFNRFWRGSTIKTPSSSGLGLYICHQIVEMHEGKISCKSEVGKGSKFIVKFPCESVSLIEKPC